MKAFFSNLVNRVAGHPLVARPLVAWALWGGYAGLIFYLSSRQLGPILSGFPPNTDKLIHMIEYGGFGVLTYHALSTANRSWRGRWLHLVLTIVIGIAYGVSDEYHQSFVPTRDADARDVVADSAGTALASWIFSRIRRVHVIHNRTESHQSLEK